MKKYKESLLIFLFKVIPKGFISRVFGHVSRIHLPKLLLNPLISWFCKQYGVNTDEILYPDGGFISFDNFFSRSLKEGTHVIDNSKNAIISPVDARIDKFGRINLNSIIQAKGIEYSLESFVPSDSYKNFIDGFFITLYLSPADYHRIHSPVSGHISGCFSIPGKLFTVQEFMVNGQKGLFTKNERVISYIMNDHGLVGVCKVGAMNVGRITLSYLDLVSNKAIRRKKEIIFPPDARPEISKGDELGAFHLGSTIIMLFQKDQIKFENIEEGQKIRVGERIASFL